MGEYVRRHDYPVRLIVDVVLRETEKAYLIVVGYDQIWIPKSQMCLDDELEAGDEDVEIFVTRWITEEKGLEHAEES
jgi:hypothetical protein